MKRIVVGALGLGVAGALAASGAAVAHFVTVAAQSPAHKTSTTQGKSNTNTNTRDGDGMGSGMLHGGTPAATSSTHLRVYLKDTHGDRVAQVDITPLVNGGNLVGIDASNLKPGYHAIQLHAVGSCDASGDAAYASAGSLLQPSGSGNSPAGAFPVLHVGSNGKAEASFVDKAFTLKDLSGPSGSSIVLYSVFPAGWDATQADAHRAADSRSRIACGVVYRSRVNNGGQGTGGQTPSPMPTWGGATTPPAGNGNGNNGGGMTNPGASPTTLSGPHW